MNAAAQVSGAARTTGFKTGLNALIESNAAAGLRKPIPRQLSVNEDHTGQHQQQRSRTVVVKDNICTSTLPTTCASAILQDFVSPFRATVVGKLECAGFSILAKSNLDEFGMGFVKILYRSLFANNERRSDSIYTVHGAVKNIYTREGDALSSGGSSGGSAVAVASGECDA